MHYVKAAIAKLPHKDSRALSCYQCQYFENPKMSVLGHHECEDPPEKYDFECDDSNANICHYIHAGNAAHYVNYPTIQYPY